MCVHMFDTARWMLNLGWPTRITSDGGIRVDGGTTLALSDNTQVTNNNSHQTNGGGIYNSGMLTLTGVTVKGKTQSVDIFEVGVPAPVAGEAGGV